MNYRVTYINRKEKWWFFWLRGMNLIAFRFWWLFLALFACALWWLYPCLFVEKNIICEQVNEIERKSDQVISALDDCCNCMVVSNIEPCDTKVAESGGTGFFEKNHDLGAVPGTVHIAYDMKNIPDQMDVYYDNKLVASTQYLVSNLGYLSFFYPAKPGKPRFCRVVMTAPQAGTAWMYHLGCPK
jgi:hypothetical protein